MMIRILIVHIFIFCKILGVEVVIPTKDLKYGENRLYKGYNDYQSHTQVYDESKTTPKYSSFIASQDTPCNICSQYDFIFDSPVGSLGSVYNFTAVFLNPIMSIATITARGYDNITGKCSVMKIKNDSPCEVGLGLIDDLNLSGEIDINHFIQLDLSDFVNTVGMEIQITINSIQINEFFQVFGSDEEGVIGTLLYTSSMDTNYMIVSPKFPFYRYFSVKAAINDFSNVLIYSLQTKCSPTTLPPTEASTRQPSTLPSIIEVIGFQNHSDYATGPDASHLATGDFNKDGVADIVNNNSGNSTISLLLGNGDGTFQHRVDYKTDVFPSIVVAADVNNDEKMDVVTLCSTSFNILLGNGDGSLQSAILIPITAEFPNENGEALAVADFNNDGNLDAVVSTFCVSNCSITSTKRLIMYLGTGTGDFEPFTNFVFEGASFITAADFNSDGNMDIVTIHFNFTTFVPNVNVRLGNGDGSFGEPIVNLAGGDEGIFSPTAADYNGDGIVDIAVVDFGGVDIFLGRGDGTFAPSINSYAPEVHTTMSAVDINNDGVIDIVAGGYFSKETVTVLLGQGNGKFIQNSVLVTRNVPRWVVTADFNGDGLADIATCNYDDSISILLQI